MNIILINILIALSLMNIKKTIKYNYFGTWKIIKYYVPYLTSFDNNKEIDVFKGKKIIISPHQFITPFDAPLDSCNNPIYALKKMNSDSFFLIAWNGHVNKKWLDIKSDSLLVVAVNCGGRDIYNRNNTMDVGSDLFNLIIRNDSTMLFSHYNGVVFFLKRVTEKKGE